MKHVAAHRWADAFAGKLAGAELARMEAHADDCESCAKARGRVHSASQSFPSLKAQSTPELSWDSVRAKVHWSVSTQRRAKVGAPGRVRWMAIGALGAGGLALALATDPIGTPSRGHDAPIARATPDVSAPPPAALAGLVSRTTGQVMIDGVRRNADAFDQTLAAGSVLATGDGRIDVQFGDHSALSLSPSSTLSLRRFDAERIELVVEGTVDIQVAPRAPGQRFVVLAGDRVIEVRGTQFRVTHDATKTQVACRHGKVAVGDVEVGAGKKLEVAEQAALDPARVAALSAAELDVLAQAAPSMLPIWSSADALVQSSAPLEIATVGKRAVRVDGVELGDAPLRVRVIPGRHTVETADSAGRFRRSGWVDVEAKRPAHVEVHADEVVPTGGTAVRRAQLRTGIDRGRLAQCTRAMAKQGLLEGSYVQIEIAVDGTGAVSFLNVIDTDLPSTTSACVREVLTDVRFKAGPAATFRYKLDL